MSDLINVADQVKAWAKRNEAIAQLAEALERVGSIEQAESEAQQRLETLRSEIAAVDGRREAALDALNEAEIAARDTLANAQAQAAKLKRQGEADAAAKLQEADDEGKKILAEARLRATQVLNDAHEKVAGKKRDAEALEKEAQEASDRRNAALAELEVLQKKIAAAKAEAKRLLE